MNKLQRIGQGAVVGWVLLTLLVGGVLALAVGLQPWRPGDLLTPYERAPYSLLTAAVTVLLAALQAQWLLGLARRREHEEQRARLATIVENSSDAIVGESTQGRIVFWNRAAERLFGHTEAHAVGSDVVELLFPAGAMPDAEPTRARIHSRMAMPAFDTVCCHRDGRLIDVSVAVSSIVTRSGQLAGSALQIRDISERKAHERQLLELNAQLESTVGQRTFVLEKAERDLRTVLDTVPAKIGYWDCDLFNRVANIAYHDWFGVPAGQLPGRSMRVLMSPELFEEIRPFIEAVLRGEPQTFERTAQRPDGQRRLLAQYIPDRQADKVMGFYAVVHDITDQHESRRRLTDALRENQALLQTITSHSIYSVADLRGNIIDVNEGFCRISGYSREELLGQNHHIVNSGTHSHRFWVEMWRCISSGQAWRAEVCNRAKDGSPYWVDTIIAPFCGADGAPERYISIRHDITDAKRAAIALANERVRLDNILRGTNVGTWEWNVHTGQTRFDERWATIIGRSLAELAPVNIQTWTDPTHPDDLKRSGELLQRHFDGELPYYECETRMQHADGHWVWVLDRGQVRTWTPDGKPEWMYGTHQDIQDRHAAEDRLRDSEAFLERVGDVAGVGGWEYDVERGLLSWTRQTRRISGVDDRYEPTLYKSLAFYVGESRALMARAMHEAADAGRPFDLELAYRTANGKQLWVRAVGEAQGQAYGAGGGPRRVVGAFQDITERRRSSEALLVAKAAAEAASAAKSAFLSNMSHEIRTPLNAVIGVTHLLADTAMNDDQRLLLGKAQMAGRSLLGIVNDVLDLAKIEAGEIALDEGPYQPLALLGEIDAVYAPLARQQGLAFTVEVAADVPAWLHGDSARLRQVLVNLVSNALKFTSVGGVQVKLSLCDVPLSDTGTDTGTDTDPVLVPVPECCSLRVCVRDSGIGIDADVQARLFSPFIQADVSTTRRYGGTGLGLSIVKRLAQIMGGEAGLNSTPGVGSEFWVVVPQTRPSTESAGQAETALGGHAMLEVLVVDDNPVDRLSLASQVRALGWRAVPLDSGRALVHEVRGRLDAGRPLPDALLVDWQMPELDGLQALAELAGQVGTAQLPAALVVTAHERGRIASHDHSHLADHILTKPVGSSDLFNAINDSLARRQGSTEKVLQSTRLDAADALWLADVHVLLVDDSDINLEVARRLLERRGAKVQTCTNGRQALDRLRASPTAFDAVLMDVQMPDMDGLEASRRIRSELGLCKLPVIALTAGALVEERRRALDAGMQGFLPKPLDPAQLIRMLRRFVEAARGAALPVKGLVNSPAPGSSPWPLIDGINTNDVARRLGSDVPLFLSLLRSLLAEFGGLAEDPDLRLDVPAQRQALSARMHKLRGSAGTIGALELHRLAAAAEQALRSPQADAASAVHAVGRSLARLATQCRSVLATQQTTADGEAADTGPAPLPAVDCDARVQGLVQGLLRQDLAALDIFRSLEPALRAVMGAQATRGLAAALDMLEFSRALALLAQSFPAAAAAVAAAGPTLHSLRPDRLEELRTTV